MTTSALVQGVEKLIMPVIKAKHDALFYSSRDTIFDIYMKVLSTGNGSRDHVVKELNCYY